MKATMRIPAAGQRKMALTALLAVLFLMEVGIAVPASAQPRQNKNNHGNGWGHENNRRDWNERESWKDHQRKARSWNRLNSHPYQGVIYAPPPVVYAPQPYYSPGFTLVMPLNFR